MRDIIDMVLRACTHDCCARAACMHSWRLCVCCMLAFMAAVCVQVPPLQVSSARGGCVPAPRSSWSHTPGNGPLPTTALTPAAAALAQPPADAAHQRRCGGSGRRPGRHQAAQVHADRRRDGPVQQVWHRGNRDRGAGVEAPTRCPCSACKQASKQPASRCLCCTAAAPQSN